MSIIAQHGLMSVKVGGGGGGGDFVTIGGRVYPVVKIGNQLWMAENLDYKFEGLIVGQEGASNDIPKANYYNNQENTYGVNGNKYGLLYNFAAAKYLEDNKNTLLSECPDYHVPYKEDFETLIETVGGSQTACNELKSKNGWSENGNGEDSYNFSMFPCGRYTGSSFNNVGYYGYLWSSLKVGDNTAFFLEFGYNMQASNLRDYLLRYSLSIRLCKNI